MGGTILYYRFHSFPRLSNIFIIKLTKLHNITSGRLSSLRFSCGLAFEIVEKNVLMPILSHDKNMQKINR
jgi:hypothetical protein